MNDSLKSLRKYKYEVIACIEAVVIIFLLII